MKISLAPLQGYTDWVFRQVYKKYIWGIDEYYTPFLILQNDEQLKSSHIREVEPFEKRSGNLIPQFMCGSAREFQFFESYFGRLGYSKMNWNMGCPYPMLTKRKKGSGLLPFPNSIREILESSYQKNIGLSVKMRLGLDEINEIDVIIPMLQELGVEEVIVHPRIGKQQYKGNVDLDKFHSLFQKYGNFLAYNGDISTVNDFSKLMIVENGLNHIMIGRGVLTDYWLPAKIQKQNIPNELERKQILKKMHDDIFQTYADYLSGNTQILNKMKPFWEYYSCHFENERKVYKGIKKSGGMTKYNMAVDYAFTQKLK